MAIADFPTVNGILQTDNNGVSSIVLAPAEVVSTTGWAQAPLTWDAWLNYNVGSDDELIWITEPIVMERNDYFNIETTIDATGEVEYTVWTSTTGAFNGEEEQVVINENDENITGFYGKYAVLGIRVQEIAANGIVQINRFSWKTTGRTLALYFNDYRSVDLTGSIGARKLYPSRPLSWIKNVQITPKSSEGYVADDYVAVDYFEGSSGFIVANLRSKGGDHFTVGLFDSSGNPTEGVFDAVAQILPEQYADGPNIRAR